MIFTFIKSVKALKEKLTDINAKHIVVYLSVKAAGVLCVLGISFGIGTYVLYKIYDKYFKPKGKPKISRSGQLDKVKDNEYCTIETDEGIMGNQQSSLADIPVYYKKGYGVSLYNPSDNEHSKLRHRKPGVLITELDNESALIESFDKDVKRTNGMVAIKSGSLNGGMTQSEGGNGRRVPDISSLNIAIDESGFVEDDRIDTNYDKMSITGNFSPTSLYEKNCKYGIKSMSDIDTDNELSDGDNKNVNYNSKSANKASMARLNVETNLQQSSVLLTPPSEDEMSTSSSHPAMSPPSTHQSTKSDVSEIHSEIAEPYLADAVETDEEREKMSPLPLDKSPHRTPEKHFKKKLILKLSEISTRGGLRSNTSSTCSSPERLTGSRHGSLSADYDNSISGISSPELELLPSESTENPPEVPKTFQLLEDEIHNVEDEFETLSKKIGELSDRYTEETEDPGLQIIDTIFQRYPSIRVRQTERGVHFDRLPSLSENDSHESKDSMHSEMEERSGTDNDLSWDLENILDMVYSEGSEPSSMQNPVITNLVKSERPYEPVRTMSTDSVTGNSTFNSSVELDGTLYEDAFHLKLGMTALSNVAEQPLDSQNVVNGNQPVVNSTQPVVNSTQPVVNGDSQSKPTICNVGERLNIQDYATKEWRGGTKRAEKMKKAYAEIPTYCQCCYLRRIRGDNYCGVRGAVYQTLVNRIPPSNQWASKVATLQRLSDVFCDKNSGLEQWTFANRLPFTSANRLEVMSRCVSAVFDKFEEINQHSEYTQREQLVEKLLNSDPVSDLDLMEGVKLLMLLSAVNLHGDMQQGNEVPVFAWLMFARDTSEDLTSFVRNHLNTIGDTGGLEQVEMFLLGYTLGVRIEVFRLSQFGEDDFISYYPDDCSKHWSTISLIAEDDRHYNVPVL